MLDHDRSAGSLHIPGDKNMPRIVLGRGLAERVDRVKAPLGQGSADVAVEPALGLAELPIGGVDQA